MIIENLEALKNWLEACLGGISDADPAALAKYVLALVKKDKPENELYSFVLDQLEIFLHKDTKYFVDLLFETLKTNSYLYSTQTTSDNSTIASKADIKIKSENILPPFPSQKTSHNSTPKIDTGNLASIKERGHTYDRPPSPLADEKFKRLPSSAITKARKYDHEKTESSTEKDINYLEDRDKGGFKPSNFSKVKSSNNNSFPHLHVAPLSLSEEKAIDEKLSKRCKDYDEKGYCMKGDLCQFDHGSDPVVVEDVSILNFNVNTANDNIVPTTLVPESQDVPPIPFQPPLPPSPPRLPPLPPLPSPNFILDGYNPESPGMNPSQDHTQHSPYYLPFKTGIHIPSHNSTTSGLQNQPHSKPLRSRELIGVPTVQIEKVTSSTSLALKENSLATSNIHDSKKRKSDIHSRLGPPNAKRYAFDDKSKGTLLVRRIPKHLNNILELNNHFSKFGTVTNIQVSFNGNPEDALVKFQNHYEAVAAYRSTEAVLNNRFIRVFWHSNFNSDSDLVKPESFPTGSVDTKKEAMHTFENKTKISQDKLPESSVSYSTKGNLCRTVFNPASFVSKKTDTATPVKSQKEDKKEVLNKRLALHKKAQEFLELQIQHQKLILARLSKAKNEKEKKFLKKTIQDLATTITALQADQKKSGEELKKLFFKSTRTKSDIEKELLDAEMDLYKQQNSGSDTTARILRSKINELRQKAKSLGLLDSSRPVELSKKFPIKPVTSDLLKLDNRPKTLLVSNFQDKEALKKHFLQFGKLEKINDSKLGITVCFNARKAAEMALLNGRQLGSTNLSLSWFQDHSASKETDDIANIEKATFNYVDEDEEVIEGRTWRQ